MAIFYKFLKIIKFIVIWGGLASIISVVFFRFVPPPATPLMLLRCAEQKINGKAVRLQKEWKSIDELNPNLMKAVVASEDQNFLYHHGFDFPAIQKAFKNNGKNKRKVKGASTISQQVAKNLFLWPGRSWIRKGFEVYFTALLEIFWSKKRILEMYLNITEMGDGIYGAEAASSVYFKKSANAVTSSQAALIAAVLPNPRKWTPATPTSYILKRQSWILMNMKSVDIPNIH